MEIVTMSQIWERYSRIESNIWRPRLPKVVST
jgi:hypothetical protein